MYRSYYVCYHLLGLFDSTVSKTMLWCTESWNLTTDQLQHLQSTQNDMLRRIVGKKGSQKRIGSLGFSAQPNMHVIWLSIVVLPFGQVRIWRGNGVGQAGWQG